MDLYIKKSLIDVYVYHLTFNSFNFENNGSVCDVYYDFVIILIALFCSIFIFFNEFR